MSRNEIISNLELMRAEVEWEYPIDYAATIDEVIELVKERKIGHWIIEGFENEISCCSECHTKFPFNYDLDALGIEMNYCPNCGAKIEM